MTLSATSTSRSIVSKDNAQQRVATRRQDWLSLDFDESIPAQVQLSGWALKVLDVVQAVTGSEVAQLQSSLERYRAATKADTFDDNEESSSTVEERLIQEFEDVWSRAEDRFRENLRQQEHAEKLPEDIGLRREVSGIMQRLRGDGGARVDEEAGDDDAVQINPTNGAEQPAGFSDSAEREQLNAKEKDTETNRVPFPDLTDARRLLKEGILFNYTHGYQGKRGMLSPC